MNGKYANKQIEEIREEMIKMEKDKFSGGYVDTDSIQGRYLDTDATQGYDYNGKPIKTKRTTTVARIGLPVDYLLYTHGQIDLNWIRETIANIDLDYISAFDILVNSYLNIHHEGKRPLYVDKAIRIPNEDYERLQEFSKNTGMSIKVATHMILTIGLNDLVAKGGA